VQTSCTPSKLIFFLLRTQDTGQPLPLATASGQSTARQGMSRLNHYSAKRPALSSSGASATLPRWQRPRAHSRAPRHRRSLRGSGCTRGAAAPQQPGPGLPRQPGTHETPEGPKRSGQRTPLSLPGGVTTRGPRSHHSVPRVLRRPLCAYIQTHTRGRTHSYKYTQRPTQASHIHEHARHFRSRSASPANPEGRAGTPQAAAATAAAATAGRYGGGHFPLPPCEETRARPPASPPPPLKG